MSPQVTVHFLPFFSQFYRVYFYVAFHSIFAPDLGFQYVVVLFVSCSGIIVHVINIHRSIVSRAVRS